MTPQPVSLAKPTRSLGSFFAGATYPFRALHLFARTPALRGYVIAPILINLVLGATLYAGLLTAGLHAIDAIGSSLPGLTSHWSTLAAGWATSLPAWLTHWPAWLANGTLALLGWLAWVVEGLVRLGLGLLLLLAIGFVFLQFGVLLGAPWYGKLSEEIETARTGRLQTIEVGLVPEIGRAVAYELKKLTLTLVLTVGLLLLNLLPGLGTVAAGTLWIAWTASIVCMDFLDAAVERRRPRFRRKLGLVWGNLPATAGFGLVCLGLVSIPLINLLAIPVCVAAGTLFFCDRLLPALQVEKPDQG